MRCFSLAGAAVLSMAAASATTLVAVWSPTEVLLAADSSVMTESSGQTAFSNACKIGQQKSAFFAFSGLVDDRATGYGAEALAQQAVTQGRTIEERLSRFLELAREPLARSVALVKSDSPSRYAFLQHGHPVLQAIFAFGEQGPPSLAIAGFELSADGALSSFSKVIAHGDDG